MTYGGLGSGFGFLIAGLATAILQFVVSTRVAHHKKLALMDEGHVYHHRKLVELSGVDLSKIDTNTWPRE